MTVVKGYTVVKTISTAFAETQVAMAGASTGMTILGTVVKLFTGEALAATTATGLLSGAIGVLANPIALAVVAVEH